MIDENTKDKSEAVLSQIGITDVELRRYRSAIKLLRPLLAFLKEPVLDFGASYGLSMLALATLGVRDTWGIEPDTARVRKGAGILPRIGLSADRLVQVTDTRSIPFPASSFASVLSLAVIEHIPQPRTEFIREMWRVLKPGGHLIIAETPNKYFPIDLHTTGLPLLPWLPSRIAYILGQKFGRNRGWYETSEKWDRSGWRGLGYYELTTVLPDTAEVIHEGTKLRHSIFGRLGLFPGLIDPYPIYLLRKGHSQSK